jgi:hypothetical protein
MNEKTDTALYGLADVLQEHVVIRPDKSITGKFDHLWELGGIAIPLTGNIRGVYKKSNVTGRVTAVVVVKVWGELCLYIASEQKGLTLQILHNPPLGEVKASFNKPASFSHKNLISLLEPFVVREYATPSGYTPFKLVYERPDDNLLLDDSESRDDQEDDWQDSPIIQA